MSGVEEALRPTTQKSGKLASDQVCICKFSHDNAPCFSFETKQNVRFFSDGQRSPWYLLSARSLIRLEWPYLSPLNENSKMKETLQKIGCLFMRAIYFQSHEGWNRVLTAFTHELIGTNSRQSTLVQKEKETRNVFWMPAVLFGLSFLLIIPQPPPY